jgi:hypothetical protein
MAFPLVLTRHLLIRLAERQISLIWIERVAGSPDWTEPDPRDPEVTRAFGRIKEAGGRILRVADADRPDGRYVLTGHFDEKQTRRRGRCA